MDTPSATTLTWPAPDIAQLTIRVPDRRANPLSRSFLAELANRLDDLSGCRLAGLIVHSGYDDFFSAGADLDELAELHSMEDEERLAYFQQGQAVFQRLSEIPFVTVAAVAGWCVGGAAEMTSWCDFRIVAANRRTRVWFPEVELGIIPAWGGTCRLPRIIDPVDAAEWIIGARRCGTQALTRSGWAVAAIPSQPLINESITVIREHRDSDSWNALRERRRKAQCGKSDVVLPAELVSRLVVERRRTEGMAIDSPENKSSDAGDTRALDDRTTPAERAAWHVLSESVVLSIDRALAYERQVAMELAAGRDHQGRWNVFMLRQFNKRDPGVIAIPNTRGAVHRVGIVGAGVMGCSIAAASLHGGLHVVMHDANESVVGRAETVIAEHYESLDSDDPVGASWSEEVHPRLAILSQEADWQSCQLVVESVVETLGVKQQVLRRIESHLDRKAVLATNTSAIPITRLAECLERPERFCGIHFCNPVRYRKLVEIVRGDATDDETVARAVVFAKDLGKMPIVVRDGPGFLVNRLLYPYLTQAFQLIVEGVPLDDIDRAAERFGMARGPLALCDLIGNDTTFFAGRTLWDMWPEFRERLVPSPILPALIKAGRLGEKSRQGFYTYRGDGRVSGVDEEVTRLLAPYIRGAQTLDDDTIVDRLLLPMVVEACRALEEGVVNHGRDVDLAMLFGLGFPASRGGLLHWVTSRGLAEVVERLDQLRRYGEAYRAPRLLIDLAGRRQSFY